MEQRPIDPQTPLPATLTAVEWNIVLGALNEAPYKVASPVIQKLISQLSPGAELPQTNPEVVASEQIRAQNRRGSRNSAQDN